MSTKAANTKGIVGDENFGEDMTRVPLTQMQYGVDYSVNEYVQREPGDRPSRFLCVPKRYDRKWMDFSDEERDAWKHWCDGQPGQCAVCWRFLGPKQCGCVLCGSSVVRNHQNDRGEPSVSLEGTDRGFLADLLHGRLIEDAEASLKHSVEKIASGGVGKGVRRVILDVLKSAFRFWKSFHGEMPVKERKEMAQTKGWGPFWREAGFCVPWVYNVDRTKWKRFLDRDNFNERMNDAIRLQIFQPDQAGEAPFWLGIYKVLELSLIHI